MKNVVIKIAFVFTLALAALTHARGQKKIDIKPIVGIDMYLSRAESIKNPQDNQTFTYVDTSKTKRFLRHNVSGIFDYDATLGFKATYQKITVKFITVTSITTDNFVSNNPYSSEYIFNISYKVNDNVKIEAEHMCLHPVNSEKQGINYMKRASHNKVSIHYNF